MKEETFSKLLSKMIIETRKHNSKQHKAQGVKLKRHIYQYQQDIYELQRPMSPRHVSQWSPANKQKKAKENKMDKYI